MDLRDEMTTAVYGGPLETLAAIRIFGVDLDFEGISRQLGVRPSESHRRGDRGLTSTPYTHDMWCLDSPHPRSEPLEVHLLWLGQTLLPHSRFLRSLRREYEVSSYCGVTVEGDGCQFRISAEGLRLFIELDVDITLSFVFFGYSDASRESLSAGRSEVGPSVDWATTSLGFAGTDLDINQISAGLGLKPSELHRSEYVGSQRSAHHGHWSLETTLPRTTELDKHLKWMGTTLLPHAAFLQSLMERVELLIQCNVVMRSEAGSVSVSPEGLRVVTDLAIPMEIKALLI